MEIGYMLMKRKLITCILMNRLKVVSDKPEIFVDKKANSDVRIMENFDQKIK
jgi:hypothetical protein